MTRHDMHQQMAAALDTMYRQIRGHPEERAREDGATQRPRWPMIILRSPKGWTGPKEVDGKPVEGTWRAHQVPLDEMREKPDHLQHARRRGCELQARRTLRRKRQASAPNLPRSRPRAVARMGMNPHANGGLLLSDLRCRISAISPSTCRNPAQTHVEATRVLGNFFAT